MGIIRKTASMITVGAIDFRSDKERTAAYTRGARKAARQQVKLTKRVSQQQADFQAAQLLAQQRTANAVQQQALAAQQQALAAQHWDQYQRDYAAWYAIHGAAWTAQAQAQALAQAQAQAWALHQPRSG